MRREDRPRPGMSYRRDWDCQGLLGVAGRIVPPCPLCESNMLHATGHVGHVRHEAGQRVAGRLPMSILQRKIVRTGAEGGAQAVPEDAAVQGMFPSLWEYLTAVKYGDGDARVPSTLLIFAEDGMFKVCLNDRDSSAASWSSGSDILGAVASLEGRLASGTAEWRVKPPAGAGPSRGKRS